MTKKALKKFREEKKPTHRARKIQERERERVIEK